ncbi:MAG: hypothetical protein ACT6Q7_02675 [Blastomonas fulva]|uniref:hypothetical protein n=1 Tax=Blastomonas fulva TaxID=1550728 RepID=UPI0040336045
MPEYIVKDKATGKVRLVDADNNAQALRHVAQDVFEVRVATRKEMFVLAGQNVQLETYGVDPRQGELEAEGK